MGNGKYTHSKQSQVSLRLFLPVFSCVLAVLQIVTCGKGTDVEMKVVSVQELSKIIESGEEIFLLDVRTKSEYEQAHLEKTDDLIPFDQLQFNLDRLPKNKNAAIYCYCRVGRRSGIAAELLISKGFTNVYNMEGGIVAWNDAGLNLIWGP